MHVWVGGWVGDFGRGEKEEEQSQNATAAAAAAVPLASSGKRVYLHCRRIVNWGEI